MFTVNDENGFTSWRPQSPDACYPARDVQEWEVPSLVGGDDETSPTASFDSFNSFSNIHSANEAKPISDFAFERMNGSFGKPSHQQVSIHSDNAMPMGNSFGNVYYDLHQPFTTEDNNDVTTGLVEDDRKWSAGADFYDQDTAPYLYHATPQQLSAFAPDPKPITDADTFSYFGLELTPQQMSAMGYGFPQELAADERHDQPEHVIPGLLSNNVMDHQPLSRATSLESTVPDQDFKIKHDSSPLPQADFRILASQQEEDEDDVPDETALSSQHLLQPDGNARNDRDSFLLQSRRNGLSYKEIKRRGGFAEAESTLRGRIRILSKPKHERVRKPQWRHNDVSKFIISFPPRSPFHLTGTAHSVLPTTLLVTPFPPSTLVSIFPFVSSHPPSFFFRTKSAAPNPQH